MVRAARRVLLVARQQDGLGNVELALSGQCVLAAKCLQTRLQRFAVQVRRRVEVPAAFVVCDGDGLVRGGDVGVPGAEGMLLDLERLLMAVQRFVQSSCAYQRVRQRNAVDGDVGMVRSERLASNVQCRRVVLDGFLKVLQTCVCQPCQM